MADMAAQRPDASSHRPSESDTRPSFDRLNDSRYDQAPLPNPPAGSIQSAVLESPKTTIDASDFREKLEAVLQSDIGVSTLLNRLKQSIASAKDFSIFLKERSGLEEKHAQGLKRLCRSTHELIRRPDSKQGSFAQSYDEITGIHDRMADNGMQFSSSLHHMSDELQELAANLERGRKHWKHTGMSSEQRLQEAEAAMGKAKSKYDVLAEQYDRARTGDRQSGRFGLKTKSAAQQEEELGRKVQAADADYASRVQAAQASRQELVTSLRPQAVRALTELINEGDSGLGLQLQKFASLNEKLLLGNGLCVSPLNSEANGPPTAPRSLRQSAQNVDHEKDFRDYIIGFSNKVSSKPAEIKYEKHPALAPVQKPQPVPVSQPPTQPPPQFSSQAAPPSNGPIYNDLQSPDRGPNPPNGFQQGHRASPSGQVTGITSYQRPDQYSNIPPPPNQYNNGPTRPNQYNNERPPPSQVNNGPPPRDRFNDGPPPRDRFNDGPPPRNQFGDGPPPPNQYNNGPPPPMHSQQTSYSGNSIPQIPLHSPLVMPGTDTRPEIDARHGSLSTDQGNNPGRGHSDSISEPISALTEPNRYRDDQQIPFSTPGPGPMDHYRSGSITTLPNNPPPPDNRQDFSQNAPPNPPSHDNGSQATLPALKPVFGVSLDEAFRRDGTAVSPVVLQCTMAVEMFGLDTEGIYRTSGSTPLVNELKGKFDHDATQISLSNPTIFNNDITTITTLLKQYLRDLPDPLLTSAQYPQFLSAARIDDAIIRRDSLHALINDLPDPNYATLRHLTLHLWRVASHQGTNRMTVGNLAIVFGPTVMGMGQGGTGGIGVAGQGGQGGQAGGGKGYDVRDAGWQARVVETIVLNTLQIFDEDE